MQDLDYLIEILKKKDVKVINRKKYNYIMYQGIETDYVYLLLEGVVKISSVLKDGREFNIFYVTETDFISLLEDSSDGEIAAAYNARVESDEVSFYRIPRRDFWRWVEEDFRLFKIVNDFYKRRLVMNLSIFQNMTVKGKKGAVCAHLYDMIETFGIKKPEGILIDFPMTNEDIAGFCGISSRSSVNRILHDLKGEGVIDIIDGQIMIYDQHYLRNFVD
ncbi:Crp/Fnr family transcriptional regulator [Lactococcus termiticola]|uniref:cAMP-binding protein n=1 Tax=Lactococcus termiticola TaxID=2169526 RepID=A0A2R5HD69_9LACT|nr:Crp/Fnr family transcriptional regulator [Lactococcus termiticola]GBG96019.1 cAMP-binding protein [Lactococcus termiticola]